MRNIMKAATIAALLTVPTLAFAQSGYRTGYRAHAQAPARAADSGAAGVPMSAARVRALHDCTALEQKWDQRTWGVQQLDVYRACMADHGQAE